MESAAPRESAPVALSFHELLCRFAPDYLERFASAMPQRQREVLETILSCRTAALGGQIFGCPDCEKFRYLYHSCNDRHCPLCGTTDANDWLARQQARLLLPVPYFFLTFTLPDDLRTWVRSHPKLGYDLLFAASSQAIQDLARDRKRLGAQLGMLGVLHTWSRTLVFHPHIHYLIPGGGLSLDDRTWIASGKKFFLPYRPLANRFRTLFGEKLKKQAPELHALIPEKIWTQRWNINIEAAGSGENALRYLARYVFKTATGNRRLLQLPDGKVRWPFRSSQTRQWTHQDFTPEELIRRFVQHVLPQGYCRVRCFGWFHPAAKVRLNRVRALLRLAPVLSVAQKQTWKIPEGLWPAQPSPLPERPPVPAPLCPCCQKPMIFLERWEAGDTPPPPQLPRPP
jgi:hypothetical protein